MKPQMILLQLLFLLINVAALALGGLFTSKGVASEWYANLLKAPWTPPGWMFGFAWAIIMICFSFYMMWLWNATANKTVLLLLFLVQWILNVLWNPTFFYFRSITGGLMVIVALTILVGYFLFAYKNDMKLKSLFILPYFVWLIIATSLNAYILIKN